MTTQNLANRFVASARCWPLVALCLFVSHCGEQAAFVEKEHRNAPSVDDAAATADANGVAGDAMSRGGEGDGTGGGTDGAAGEGGEGGVDGVGDGSYSTPEDPRPATNIEFGADVVYHLGDNSFDDSTCISEISAYPIIGYGFFFEFEVLEDATEISGSINKICGVDYDQLNFVNVTRGARSVTSRMTIGIGQTTFEIPSMVLDKGRHSIYVASVANLANKGDYDDFIIGNIRVKASKNIMPIGTIPYP